MLAGLNSYGNTTILETQKADHTENILINNKKVMNIKGKKKNNKNLW